MRAFRLASEGEPLALVDPNGGIVHAYIVDVPHQYARMSYGLAAEDSGLQFQTVLVSVRGAGHGVGSDR